MDRATISLFLVYSSLSLTDGRKKKNVGGRDPISRRAGCGTGSGWTVAQLLERGRGYRYETARRAYAATKEAGPPRIKLRSFASSGRWSRASTRPIFDRDPGMYLSCHLLHFSFPFSTTLRIFIERILRYLILNFFFFFQVDRIENTRSNRKKREEIAKALSTSIVVVSIYYSPSLCRVSIERIL